MSHETHPTQEAAPRNEFFDVLDYPEAANHKAQFDVIAAEVAQKLAPAYQNEFTVCANMVRWSIWPTGDLPYGVTAYKYGEGTGCGVDDQLTGIDWAVRVLHAHGMAELDDSIRSSRKSLEPAVLDVIKRRFTEHPVVVYTDSFDTEQSSVSERPLTYVEQLQRQAELRHKLGINKQSELVEAPHLQQIWRQGLHRIDREMIPVLGADVSPLKKLTALSLRGIEVDDPNHRDRTTKQKFTPELLVKHALANQFEDTFTYAAGGIIDLVRTPDLKGSGMLFPVAYYLESLTRGLAQGASFSAAKTEALHVAATKALQSLQSYLDQETSHYEELAWLGGLERVADPLPVGTFPKLKYPDDSSIPSVPTAAQHKTFVPGSSDAPLGTLPKSQPITSTNVQFNNVPKEIFGLRKTPTVGTVPRLLELIAPYDHQTEGDPDMKLQLRSPLGKMAMPRVLGYQLLGQVSDREYWFTRAADDAYAPAPIPLAMLNRERLAHQLYDVGMHSLAEHIGNSQNLTLDGLSGSIANASVYVRKIGDFKRFHDMPLRTIADIAPLVRDERYHTQCTGAALLLRAAVDVALPEAHTRIVSGKLLPATGRRIATTNHWQLETIYDGSLYRHDATPSLPTLSIDAAKLSALLGRLIHRPEIVVGRNMPAPHEEIKRIALYTQATDFAKELLCSITDSTPDRVIDEAVKLSEDDPLRLALALLLNEERVIPDEAAARSVAAQLKNLALADPALLRAAGLNRYKTNQQPLLKSLADRLEAIYEQPI